MPSRWHMNGAPDACQGCGQPFPREGENVRAVRTGNGYFCDEDCANDHLEALAKFRRRAS